MYNVYYVIDGKILLVHIDVNLVELSKWFQNVSQVKRGKGMRGCSVYVNVCAWIDPRKQVMC